MRAKTKLWAAGSAMLFATLCGACSSSAGGGDATNPSTGRPPFTTCLVSITDSGSHRYSSNVCADSPTLAGCRMCLQIPGIDAGGAEDDFCVYACRIGQQDCPAGQTCLPQPGGSRDTVGSCRTFASPSALGYCR